MIVTFSHPLYSHAETRASSKTKRRVSQNPPSNVFYIEAQRQRYLKPENMVIFGYNFALFRTGKLNILSLDALPHKLRNPHATLHHSQCIQQFQYLLIEQNAHNSAPGLYGDFGHYVGDYYIFVSG